MYSVPAQKRSYGPRTICVAPENQWRTEICDSFCWHAPPTGVGGLSPSACCLSALLAAPLVTWLFTRLHNTETQLHTPMEIQIRIRIRIQTQNHIQVRPPLQTRRTETKPQNYKARGVAREVAELRKKYSLEATKNQQLIGTFV